MTSQQPTANSHPIAASIAMPYACRLIERLSPACHKIQIAGSLRRACSAVHDIDLVAHPITEEHTNTNLFGDEETTQITTPALDDVIDQLTATDAITLIKRAGARRARLVNLLIETDTLTIPVDLYLCEPDGSNYHALLQMRTGPEELNQFLAAHAKRIGLKYRAGYGIYDPRGKRIDDGTEPGIFTALRLIYSKPQHRHLSLDFAP